MSNHLAQRNGKVIFKKTGNQIPVVFLKHFRYEYSKMVMSFSDPRVTILKANKDFLLVEVDNVKLYIKSLSNIVTFYELFIEKIYDVHLMNEQATFVDIGMNVGYASILFASKKHTQKVFSFEPFLMTYNEAIENINLNEHLKDKIVAHNYGISDYSSFINVPLMESGSGGASTNKDILKINNTSDLPLTTVEIRSINNIFDELQDTKNIFFKIDCEGDEYPIFDYLERNNLVKKAIGYIVEWHLKGPEKILAILNRSKFSTLSMPKPDGSSGMIYSFSEQKN
jgi:FkbM family methyltransferase